MIFQLLVSCREKCTYVYRYLPRFWSHSKCCQLRKGPFVAKVRYVKEVQISWKGEKPINKKK